MRLPNPSFTTRPQRKSSHGHTAGTAIWRAPRQSSHGGHGEPRRPRRGKFGVRSLEFGVPRRRVMECNRSAEPAGNVERNPQTRNLTRASRPHDAAPNSEPRTPNSTRHSTLLGASSRVAGGRCGKVPFPAEESPNTIRQHAVRKGGHFPAQAGR